jgi:Fe2+ transport system protein FeoA
MRLSDVPIGRRYIVNSIDVFGAFRFRELGIYEGSEITTIQKAGFDGRVIGFENYRFAVDGKTAAAIEVSDALSLEKAAFEHRQDQKKFAAGELLHEPYSPAAV